jgi:glycosyltransferase involved in cell wall biosynthesis
MSDVIAPVAVLIPARNYGEFREEALLSLRAQTVRPSEIWIIDDGSTDDTPAVIDRLTRELSELPIRSIRHPTPNGFVPSLVEGIAVSEAPLIAHVDADDRVLPRYIERLWRALEDHPDAAYAYPRMRLFGDETGVFLSGPFDAARLVYEGNYIPHIGIMRRASYLHSRGYRELETHVDWDLWLTLLEDGGRGVFVDEVLYEWRRHSSSMTMRPQLTRLSTRGRVLTGHPRLLLRYLLPGVPHLWRSLWRRVRVRIPLGASPYARTASCWIEPGSNLEPQE